MAAEIPGHGFDNRSDDEQWEPEFAAHPNHYLTAWFSKSDPILCKTY